MAKLPRNLLTTIGVDIGQKRDPTAIAVTEIEYRKSDLPRRKLESHYLVRHLERLPLGTLYPRVARRIGEICQQVREKIGQRPHLYVDSTGLGQPIVDLLDDFAPDVQRIWAVQFTHGDLRSENREEKKISLGKAFLVSRLHALLQCQRIHLPQGHREASAPVQELLNYEIRVDENAYDKFGAFRVGTHDDLVTALGLAVHKEPTISVYPGPNGVHYGI